MRVIEVHVKDLEEFIGVLNGLVEEMGFGSSIATEPEDSSWYYAFNTNLNVLTVLELAYEDSKKMCKITIRTAGFGNQMIKIESKIVEYLKNYDGQLIDHNPPPLRPPYPPTMEWTDLMPCPWCDALYRYPQPLADESKTVECPNCGKKFDL